MCFSQLNSCRISNGFSVGSIPYNAIIIYLNENEINCKTTRKFYIECLLAMDSEYLKYAAEQAKAHSSQ